MRGRERKAALGSKRFHALDVAQLDAPRLARRERRHGHAEPGIARVFAERGALTTRLGLFEIGFGLGLLLSARADAFAVAEVGELAHGRVARQREAVIEVDLPDAIIADDIDDANLHAARAYHGAHMRVHQARRLSRRRARA